MTNSSPPIRATTSESLTAEASLRETSMRSLSPASCPILSFTSLKWSRSMYSMAEYEPLFPALERRESVLASMECLFSSPVRVSLSAIERSSSSRFFLLSISCSSSIFAYSSCSVRIFTRVSRFSFCLRSSPRASCKRMKSRCSASYMLFISGGFFLCISAEKRDNCSGLSASSESAAATISASGAPTRCQNILFCTPRMRTRSTRPPMKRKTSERTVLKRTASLRIKATAYPTVAPSGVLIGCTANQAEDVLRIRLERKFSPARRGTEIFTVS